MFCSNCGEKLPPEAEFCPNCGSHEGVGAGNNSGGQSASSDGGAPVYTGGDKYLSPYSISAAFSSNMFLTMVILVTVGAFFSLVSISISSASTIFSCVFPILFSISAWLSYAGAKTQNPARVATGTKMTRGIVFAQFICTWVSIGAIAICAVVVMAIPSVGSTFFRDFSRELYRSFDGMFYYGLGTAIMIIIAFALLLVAGFLVVENLFYTRNAEKLARTVSTAAVSGGYVTKTRVVRIWLMVLGILSCCSFFGAFAGFRAFISSVGGCCLGVSMILGSLFIKRYFE